MFIRMWRLWIFFVLFFVFPTPLKAETVDFLQPKILGIEKSIVCSDKQTDCHSVFLISGKNFLNSNGTLGVRVGNEWAQVIRRTNSSLVATASKAAYEKTPIVSVDTTIMRLQLFSSDPVLVSLFEESVDVAIDSIGVTSNGTRYLRAGPKYDSPERVYYRDSYWASGLVLMIEPYVIRDQIELLASGVEPNGSTPSAITVNPQDTKIPLWVDHFDSGSYFVMLVYDYVRWTGDFSILNERVNGRTIFTTMEDIVSYLSDKDSNGNYLPEKSKNSLQDWLDNIPRSGEVFSNEVLYYRALRNLVDLANAFGEPQHAQSFHRQSLLVRYQINKLFWNKKGGYYYESCYRRVCEDRITNESALAILYDVATPEQRDSLFKQLKTLESVNNPDIAYGDWGVLNAWPLYKGFTPYHYQNGTDWAFLDGINAGARLKYANNDWYYPLTRWWTYHKETDSETFLPEYVSPVDKQAGDQQAWSVNPMVSFVRYGMGIDPDLNGSYTVTSFPDVDARIEGMVLRGKRVEIDTNR
ncbi:MAG: Amylo-alpha-1,6-glucosidase family protein [Candidatus Uhrbacteria bacterium GW2011_GWF2_39_13]|uniref:Amylo-alpha-1,6-glucosidase family protein n=1 Tax=Candidatus Uhrbacteria bacterium GW2011_GWF2_39_13 TaxID=1618995 RepID=A0A0G0Q2K2_9BACT|nr:MAG: Amylo-alpha-1,6-glucosidase family protein [Candidatus Uhrbacteria bacterium GW2011_GWF2_39_13]